MQVPYYTTNEKNVIFGYPTIENQALMTKKSWKKVDFAQKSPISGQVGLMKILCFLSPIHDIKQV